jgi:hypothetical protein
MTGRLPRGMVWLRQFAATQRELEERRRLLDRPWEEDLLHWHRDADGSVTLHGEVPPPRDGRRRSTTPEGWCPGSLPRARRAQEP